MKENTLFDDIDDKYEAEWKDMPEFNMTPEVPILTIKISFKNRKDIETFSNLIGQDVKFTMENYWFPKLNRNAFSNKKYTDEP